MGQRRGRTDRLEVRHVVTSGAPAHTGPRLAAFIIPLSFVSVES